MVVSSDSEEPMDTISGAHSKTEPIGVRSATDAEQWRLIAAGTLLVAGVFSDGYAHSNFVDDLESFITPWHGVIFAGYLACLAVVSLAMRTRVIEGADLSHAVPPGWRSSLAGVGIFAIGFLGDGIWHTLYGIEADLEALLSPTHLLMLAGLIAVLTGPVLSRWRLDGADSGWTSIATAVVATTLIMSSISFFLFWAWPPNNGYPLAGFSEFAGRQAPNASRFILDVGKQFGLAGYLIYAVVLVAPVLVLSRRWALPRGALTMITMVPWVGLSAAFLSFYAWQRLIPALVGALVMEVTLDRMNGSGRTLVWRIVGAGFPAVVVMLDMVVMRIVWGELGWPPEFVAGSAVAAAFVGYAVSVFVFPPPPNAVR